MHKHHLEVRENHKLKIDNNCKMILQLIKENQKKLKLKLTHKCQQITYIPFCNINISDYCASYS